MKPSLSDHKAEDFEIRTQWNPQKRKWVSEIYIDGVSEAYSDEGNSAGESASKAAVFIYNRSYPDDMFNLPV